MTNLNRWDPFQDMLTLREAMSQLLEDSFVQPSAARGAQSFIPAVDLSETEDGFLVEAVVPGLKPEDLEIVCENNVLTIRGQVQQQTEDRKRHYHRVERRFGTFERSIGLPSSVKTDAIQATLTNGVLRLEIPKAESVKPRRINVNVGESKQLEAGKK